MFALIFCIELNPHLHCIESVHYFALIDLMAFTCVAIFEGVFLPSCSQMERCPLTFHSYSATEMENIVLGRFWKPSLTGTSRCLHTCIYAPIGTPFYSQCSNWLLGGIEWDLTQRWQINLLILNLCRKCWEVCCSLTLLIGWHLRNIWCNNGARPFPPTSTPTSKSTYRTTG